MVRAPQSPERLPTIDHNGTTIEIIQHHGFSLPDRGPLPATRILYGARDGNNERHWRNSLNQIKNLINNQFTLNPTDVTN